MMSKYVRWRGVLSPLVFSCSGGIGPLIYEKRGHPYSQTLFWIKCKLSYFLLCDVYKGIKIKPSQMQFARSGY